MVIDKNLQNNLLELQKIIDLVIKNSSLTEAQIEGFLRKLEQTRYNILNKIKIYNKTVEFEYEKIKTIDDGYTAEISDDVLKIYVPEVLPSYKNLKTHTHKRISLNVAEISRPFAHKFDDEVFIYIKVFDKMLGWDIDNRYIKPISDGLIASEVIKDDNITKMFFCAKGEFSENPHTEIYVMDSKKVNEFLENYSTRK